MRPLVAWRLSALSLDSAGATGSNTQVVLQSLLLKRGRLGEELSLLSSNFIKISQLMQVGGFRGN